MIQAWRKWRARRLENVVIPELEELSSFQYQDDMHWDIPKKIELYKKRLRKHKTALKETA